VSRDAKNWNFFQERGGEPAPGLALEDAIAPAPASSAPLKALIGETGAALLAAGFPGLAADADKIKASLKSARFKIVVVGEFSRGKSSFINQLLGRKLLPVGDTPTTALLTKITHNAEEMIVFVDAKGKKKGSPVAEKSWNGYTAGIEGESASGTAFVGVDSAWLRETGIELIDTPGAGDLDEKRALTIGDALRLSDGAVITVSAQNALSLTEMDFIESRLISAKIPYLMLVVTKLDLVKVSERAKLLRFIENKLELFGVDIPVYVPQGDLELPGWDADDYTGLGKVKAAMNQWASDPARAKKKEAVICAQMLSLLKIAEDSLREKERLMALDREKRGEVLKDKKFQLGKIQLYWEELRLEILKRANKGYEWLRDAVMERTEALIERLQYESAHASGPQKWWQEDYPYRLKVELMSLAVSLENGLTQNYTEDLRWLNSVLDRQFKLSLFVEKETIADKNLFKGSSSTVDLKFEDLEKKRRNTRLISGAATIAGFATAVATGFMPIYASVIIGTGSSLVSEKHFKRQVEQQQKAIRDAIAQDIPRVVDNALAVSEQRLIKEYERLIKETAALEETFVKTQLEALSAAVKGEGEAKESGCHQAAALIKAAIKTIEEFVEG
jgi:GTPase SAR1 family protein